MILKRLELGNKKAMSEIIGYILLIGFVMALSAVVYTWMKGYVPKEELKCPDEISIFVEDYKCGIQELNVTLKNNGKFNVGGYLIYARNYSQPGVASVDLSRRVTSGGTPLDPYGVKMAGVENSFSPNFEENHTFNIVGVNPKIYAIEIVPIRWQEFGRKEKLVTCTNAKSEEIINCESQCLVGVNPCIGRECGTRVNSCLQTVSCGTCSSGEVCDFDGQCITQASCTDTCTGLQCGFICGVSCGNCVAPYGSNICNNSYLCQPTCSPGENANCDGNNVNGCETLLGTNTNCGSCGNVCGTGDTCVFGMCVSCNGVWSPPEDAGIQCDGGANCLEDCSCPSGYVTDTVGGCDIETSNPPSNTCAGYCSDNHNPPYTTGECAINPNRCDDLTPAGVWVGDITGGDEARADSYCSLNADTCCCQAY